MRLNAEASTPTSSSELIVALASRSPAATRPATAARSVIGRAMWRLRTYTPTASTAADAAPTRPITIASRSADANASPWLISATIAASCSASQR